MLLLLLVLIAQVLPAQPDRFALPACHGALADRPSFVLCLDSGRQVPAWTAYELTPSQLAETPLPRLRHFRSDYPLSTATNADYTHSGYSRGHLVPARDLAFSSVSLRATFLLSNAAPQTQSLNCGRWQQLEHAVRQLASNADAIYVITGTLFESPQTETIGPNHVAVPTHFFKAVLTLQAGRKIMFAAILPNTTGRLLPLSDYVTSVDEIERRSNLNLFSNLDDSEEATLEGEINNPLTLNK